MKISEHSLMLTKSHFRVLIALSLLIFASGLWSLTMPKATAQTSQQTGQTVTYAGGAGDSPATAVIIRGAPDSLVGIKAEYVYLHRKFGPRAVAWKLLRQRLLNHGNRQFDLMEIELADGTKKEIFFDITEFFGKF